MILVAWLIRSAVRLAIIGVALLALGFLVDAVTTDESEQPRPGYYDTGQEGTAAECEDQGGEVVGDVCYLP